MFPRKRWVEREFTFGLPAWMFTNVLERVRGTPARLEDRLARLPREILTRRDGPRWSAQEHAGHLLDLGALDLARLDDYEAGRDQLRPADMENRRTHEADHNARPVEEVLRAFRAERGEFVRRLEDRDEQFVSRAALHPRLKQQLSVVDWLFFIAEHDDHHLASISELIRKFADEKTD